jgi:hypothetical protein
MKNEFYQIQELNLNIKLRDISSYRLDGGIKNAPIELIKCCIVVKPNSIYWCDKSHYYNLNKIFYSNERV